MKTIPGALKDKNVDHIFGGKCKGLKPSCPCSKHAQTIQESCGPKRKSRDPILSDDLSSNKRKTRAMDSKVQKTQDSTGPQRKSRDDRVMG